jgi:hypothetical protein
VNHAGAIEIALGKPDDGRAKVKAALELNPAFDPVAAPKARALLESANEPAER